MDGFDIDSKTKLSSLAFADDIILIASNRARAADLLRLTEEYLGKLGMRIASAKCTAFCINMGKDTWHITDPGMTLANGEEIPPQEPNPPSHILVGRSRRG
jgi:hypothetical protein